MKWTAPEADRIADIRARAYRGETDPDMGRAYGVTGTAIRHFRLRHGIPSCRPQGGFRSRKRAAPPGPTTSFAAPEGGVLLVDAGPWHCRWPEWPHGVVPPPDRAYVCGQAKQLGRPYCDRHHAVSIGAPAKAEAA